MSEERTRVTIENHVATVTMVRGEKHNAVDLDMFTGLAAAADSAGSTPGVRAIVLHGEGPSFCSGIDITWLASQVEQPEAFREGFLDAPNFLQRAAYAWVQTPVPVIAAVHGNCFGAGLQIALAADIRYVAPDAKLSIMEARWGLIPDMAITRTLTRLVPIDVAKELVYTARVLSGTEAHALGLATHLSDDPLAGAQALAAEIAEKSPDAVRRAKRLLDGAWTGTPEQTLRLEAELQSELLFSPNQMAAVSAGFTKQAPEFVDP